MLTFTFRKKRGQSSIELYHSGTPLPTMMTQWQIDTSLDFNTETLVLSEMNGVPSSYLTDEWSYNIILDIIAILANDPLKQQLWYHRYETLLFVDTTKRNTLLGVINTHWVDTQSTPPTVELETTIDLDDTTISILVFDKSLSKLKFSIENDSTQSTDTMIDETYSLERLLNWNITETFSDKKTLKSLTKKKAATINANRVRRATEEQFAAIKEETPDIDVLLEDFQPDLSNVELVDPKTTYQLPTVITKLLMAYQKELKRLYTDRADLAKQVSALKDTVLSDSDATGALQMQLTELQMQAASTTEIDPLEDFILKMEPPLLANPLYALNLIYNWMQWGSPSAAWFHEITKQDNINQLKLLQATINCALANVDNR